jgi:hypothetical protein
MADLETPPAAHPRFEHAPALGPEGGAVHTLEHVDQYLQIGHESDASDVHLGVNAKPIWRRFGTLEAIWLQADVLTPATPNGWRWDF